MIFFSPLQNVFCFIFSCCDAIWLNSNKCADDWLKNKYKLNWGQHLSLLDYMKNYRLLKGVQKYARDFFFLLNSILLKDIDEEEYSADRDIYSSSYEVGIFYYIH